MTNRYTENQRQINYSSSTTGIIADVRDIIEIDPLDNTKIKVKVPYTLRTVDITTPSNTVTSFLDVPITSGIVHNIPPGFTYWIGVKDVGTVDPLYNFHLTLDEFDLTEFAIIGKAFTDENVSLQLNGLTGTSWWEGFNYAKTLNDYITSREISYSIIDGNIVPLAGTLTYTRESGIYWRFQFYDSLKDPSRGRDSALIAGAFNFFTYPSVGTFEQSSTFEVGFIDVPETINVTSMTRSGSTVTVDTATSHGFSTGKTIRIDGAAETEYNGIQIITVVDLDTFTYELQPEAIPATPATGAITVVHSVKTAVPANKWSIYFVVHFASSNFESAQRGKQAYNSLHDAKSRKGEEDLPLNLDIANAAWTHIAFVKSGATDLNNPEEVVFERIDSPLSSGGDPLISSLQGSGLIDWEGTDIMEVDINTAQFKTGQFRVGKVDRTGTGEVKFIRTVAATTGNILTKISTQPFTHIAYNIDDDVFINHTGVFNRGVLGNVIPLGFIWHRNGTSIDRINNMPMTFEVSHDYVGQLLSFGGMKQNGLSLSANGANKKLNVSTGTIEVLGGNSLVRENISTSSPVALIPLTFTPVHRAVTTSKAIFGTTTDDPDYTVFDDGSGTLAVLSNVNKFGIHYIYIFPFRSTLEAFLIHGGKEYDTFEDAKDGVNEDSPPIPSDFIGGFLIGVVVAKKDTTDLTSAITNLTAKIVDSDRFGSFGGGGGVSGSTATLQSAYEAGTEPEILTNSIRGAFTLKRGSAADTDNVVEIQNGAGTINTVIRGDGRIGIGTTTVNALLQLENTITNRKIVMFDGFNNDHQFYGFGINTGAIRYQVAGSSANHRFFSAINSSSSKELMTIKGTGLVGIDNPDPKTNLDVIGTYKLPIPNASIADADLSNSQHTIYVDETANIPRIKFKNSAGAVIDRVLDNGLGGSTIIAYWDGRDDPTTSGGGFNQASLGGNASYDSVNNLVELTPNLTGQNGTMTWQLDQGAGFKAIAEFRISSAGGADAVYFFTHSTSTPGGEDASVGGYIIALDEFAGNLQLRHNGVLLDSVAGEPWADNQFHRLEVVINYNMISVAIDGINQLIHQDINGRDLSGQFLGFGARTGGVTNKHDVRRLELYKGNNDAMVVSADATEVSTSKNFKAPQYSLHALNTAPASSTATGTTGEIRWTNGFIYLCVATNTWQRSSLLTF